jgi:hypothetical protein
MGGSIDVHDPLALAIAPPPDETPDERDERLRVEAAATARSDEIDDMLKLERAELKKKKGVVKVLLLGQAESGTFVSDMPLGVVCSIVFSTGKSTTLKSVYAVLGPCMCTILICRAQTFR